MSKPLRNAKRTSGDDLPVEYIDLSVIGGGVAGMTSAIAAKKNGVSDIMIFERNSRLGGVLLQCDHEGFGREQYGKDLTGPEYVRRTYKTIRKMNIPYRLNTMVLDMEASTYENGILYKDLLVIGETGVYIVRSKAVIFVNGCREKPRAALGISGSRPAGIFSSGTAQELITNDGMQIGKKAIVLGSGNIGLLLARTVAQHGTEVDRIVEMMPYSSGSKQHIEDCAKRYNIPIQYNATITEVVGKNRLEGVYIAQVGKDRKPIKASEKFVECDTLLLAAGLVTNSTLLYNSGIKLCKTTGGAFIDNRYQTNIDGVFTAGNVLHVHDLVDFVARESFLAGESAARYVKGDCKRGVIVNVVPQTGIRYIVPNFVDLSSLLAEHTGENYSGRKEKRIKFLFRADRIYKNVYINVLFDGRRVKRVKKDVVSPANMQVISVKKSKLTRYFKKHPFLGEIEIEIEEI